MAIKLCIESEDSAIEAVLRALSGSGDDREGQICTLKAALCWLEASAVTSKYESFSGLGRCQIDFQIGDNQTPALLPV
jgi:hypothetical protein